MKIYGTAVIVTCIWKPFMGGMTKFITFYDSQRTEKGGGSAHIHFSAVGRLH
jgi:hypothetical protein